MESCNLRTLESDVFIKFTILQFSITLRVRRLVLRFVLHRANAFSFCCIYINAIAQPLAFIVGRLHAFVFLSLSLSAMGT